MDTRVQHLKSIIETYLFSDPDFQEGILDCRPVGIFCTEMEEPDVEYISPGFWRFLDITEQNCAPGAWRKYLFPADFEKADLKEEGTTTLRFFTADKRLISCHCKIRFISIGDTDKTYRITQLTPRLPHPAGPSPVDTASEPGNAVFLLDPGCRILKMNSEAELLSGVSQAKAKGRSINDVLSLRSRKTGYSVTIPNDFFLYERIEHLQSLELLALSGNDERIPVEIQGSHISDSNKKDRGSLLILKDIRQLDSIHELVHARMTLLSYAAGHTLEELLQKVLDEMGNRVDSPVGFFHFVEDACKNLSPNLSIEQWYYPLP